MDTTDDTQVAQFPPQQERRDLLDAVRQARSDSEDELANASPEVVRKLAAMNARLSAFMTDPNNKAKVHRSVKEAVTPYLLECRKIGREVFGDLWEDEIAMFYMGSVLLHAADTMFCHQCILGTHPPSGGHLHVADDGPHEPPSDGE